MVALVGTELALGGQNMSLQGSDIGYLAYTHLQEDTGLVCYRDGGNRGYGTCTVVRLE